MAIMYLIDTNIFLEILLDQVKRGECEKFLSNNSGQTYISDFSLHSIGVILFRSGREYYYQNFVDDVIPRINVISLSHDRLAGIVKYKENIILILMMLISTVLPKAMV